MKNNQLVEDFLIENEIDATDISLKEDLIELLKKSQKELISVLIQIHSSLNDKSKLNILEQNWFDAIEKLKIIEKSIILKTKINESYCSLHNKKINCKWLQKNKEACKFCAFKIKISN